MMTKAAGFRFELCLSPILWGMRSFDMTRVGDVPKGPAQRPKCIYGR
jgi:hypothetical protein